MQFMQSQPQLQQPPGQSLAPAGDCMIAIPSGLAWFDVFSPDVLLDSKTLKVIVYPGQNLLKHHLFRLKLMGFHEGRFAALTSDLPPNGERRVWEQIARQETSLLLLTAKKLQTVTTLSQLIRQPNLGTILLEQGHLLAPSLWGPMLINPYAKLPELFCNQWQGRPPLYVLHQPLPLQQQNVLSSLLGLKHGGNTPYPMPDLPVQLEVNRFITQHQKYKALVRSIQEPNMGSPRATVILCHSVKDLLNLERRLNPMPVVTLHRYMDYEEKEMHLIQALHQEELTLLVESALMAEVPLHLVPLKELRMILWQMPWSCEAMMQQVLPALHANTTRIRCQVFYTREDYHMQKRWLLSQLSETPATPVNVDHLNRTRHFLLRSSDCRVRQMEGWLSGETSNWPDCLSCDICNQKKASSLWRNLAGFFLY